MNSFLLSEKFHLIFKISEFFEGKRLSPVILKFVRVFILIKLGESQIEGAAKFQNISVMRENNLALALQMIESRILDYLKKNYLSGACEKEIIGFGIAAPRDFYLLLFISGIEQCGKTLKNFGQSPRMRLASGGRVKFALAVIKTD